MEFFKLNKGEGAIVRILHKSIDTIPLIKVHTVPTKIDSKIINAVVKCNGDGCPLCQSYPKGEYIRVLTLYDYGHGDTRCFKTTSRSLMAGIDDASKEWGTELNNLVFKISRGDDDFGTYTIAIVPANKYAATSEPEVAVDTDTSYRFGLFRSNDEMREYLKTGVMPKHQKSSNGTIGDNVYFTPKTTVSTSKVSTNTPTPAVDTSKVSTNTPTDTANTLSDAFRGTAISPHTHKVENTTTFSNEDFVVPF